MALSFTDVDGGDYANTAAPQATAAWTPPQHDLIICVYQASHTATNTVATAPTLAGNGLTWTRILWYDDPTTQTDFIAIFAADNSAGGATNGVTSLTFPGGQSMNGDSMLFHGVDGVDLSGGVAAAFVQAITNRGASTAPSLSFSAAGSSNNRPLMAVAATGSGQTVTAPGSWSKWDQLSYATPNRVAALMTRGDAFDTAPTAAITSSNNWVAAGVEIKAAVSGVNLVIQDMAVAPTLANVVLTQTHVLAIQGMAVAAALQNAVLSQAHNLTVQNMAVAEALANVVLSATSATDLVIQGMAVAAALENATLTPVYNLAIQNMAVATVEANAVLTQVHELVIQNMAIGVTVENVVLSIPGQAPIQQNVVRLRRRRWTN